MLDVARPACSVTHTPPFWRQGEIHARVWMFIRRARVKAWLARRRPSTFTTLRLTPSGSTRSNAGSDSFTQRAIRCGSFDSICASPASPGSRITMADAYAWRWDLAFPIRRAAPSPTHSHICAIATKNRMPSVPIRSLAGCISTRRHKRCLACIAHANWVAEVHRPGGREVVPLFRTRV